MAKVHHLDAEASAGHFFRRGTMGVDVAKIGAIALIITGPLLLSACSTTTATKTTSRIVAFSPENREAQALGPLTGYIEGHGGEGLIWLKLKDGEIVKGRFEVKVGGEFGAYGKSHGLDRPGVAYTIAGGRRIEGGDPAFADLKGASGVTVHCEVVNDHADAHGSGVCLFSDGAEYRVVY